MKKITINYDPDEINKIIELVRAYNCDHENRDMAALEKEAFGEKDSLLIAYEGDLENDLYTEYLLTIVPEWCHDLDTLQTSNVSDLVDLFNQYYEDLGYIPEDMYKTDVTIQVLVHDFCNMSSEVMDLTEFVDYVTECMKADFQYVEA